jgi:hypothetical protein
MKTKKEYGYVYAALSKQGVTLLKKLQKNSKYTKAAFAGEVLEIGLKAYQSQKTQEVEK